MENLKIPLFKIYNDYEDVRAITDVVKSGMNWAIGDEVAEFEQAIADYIGTKYAVVFNSGTSALHAILLAYGIGEGDEVIVPSFTFVATANAVVFTGAKPVFADIEMKTFGLDTTDVEYKITDKTKAIIAVHYSGCPCQIERLREIADDHNLILIEDAAEAMGAKIGIRKVGTYGHAAMFSFCQNKIITTGDGGAITTDDKEVYERLKLLVSHGDNEHLGYNWRMPNILAALGLSQLKKIDKLIGLRRAVAHIYMEDGMGIKPPDGYFSVYQMFTMRLNNRDEVRELLEKNGVSTKVYFDPVHLRKYYQQLGSKSGDLPKTEAVSKQVLTIPAYPTLTKEEMDYIKAICSSRIYNKK